MDSKSGFKVLVTGASGYIAGHCIEQLLAAGYSVRGTLRSLGRTNTVERLRALAQGEPQRLELVEADLADDSGWDAAVAGCRYVLHVASPFPATVPDDEDEVVRPAVEGTERVLNACARAQGVQRVVMTSSVAAIAYGHDADPAHTFTEEDWSNVERCDPYQKSKTLAERRAWELVSELPADRRFELAVINPGFVIGPIREASVNTSCEVLRRLLARDMPACPELGFAVVDVRDVARAHILAMERPEAAGNRYIAAGKHYWMGDIAEIMAAEFGPLGYRVPTARAPYWLMWLVARFDKTVRMALPYIGRTEQVSHAKISRDLGWQPRAVAESVIDTGYSLIEHGVVARTASFRPPSRPPAADSSRSAA